MGIQYSFLSDSVGDEPKGITRSESFTGGCFGPWAIHMGGALTRFTSCNHYDEDGNSVDEDGDYAGEEDMFSWSVLRSDGNESEACKRLAGYKGMVVGLGIESPPLYRRSVPYTYRHITDNLWSSLFGSMAEGCVTKRFSSKSGHVNQLTFSPDAPIPLIVSSTWMYFVATQFSEGYNMMLKYMLDNGLPPLLAYVGAVSLAQRKYSDIRTIGDSEHTVITRTSQLPWGSEHFNLKSLQSIQDVLSGRKTPQYKTVEDFLDKVEPPSYQGRDAFWSPARSTGTRREFLSLVEDVKCEHLMSSMDASSRYSVSTITPANMVLLLKTVEEQIKW